MNTSELRKIFLDYFVANGHLQVPSSSLIPHRDPSVLLTTAGMQQFKPYYLGVEEPPNPRMASCQKCFRTTDIDRVGSTARHCTFFEMLGNFSIGDYFKDEAIHFGYEFSVDYLGFDPERLWVSVFEGDDEVPPDEEAVEAWEREGIPRDRMVRLPRSENFWGPAGPTGPCGPCSELYLDRGPGTGCGGPDCKPGCDCDRYIEFWNLVFTQYNMGPDGRVSPLPTNNIDTGMGLERVAALVQGVDSVFLNDVFRPLIELGEEIAGVTFGRDEKTDVALRVLADHSRAMTFLIADGVLPGNEGRGYVLRRVIRRAARLSRSVDMQPPFLGRFSERVIETLGGAYPELAERRETVLRIVNAEEERFNRTLDQGLVLLNQEMDRALEQEASALPGRVAFVLHDTYGFPVEVTRELATERGLGLDMDEFARAMDEQRQRARASQQSSAEETQLFEFARRIEKPTDFQGYERDELFTVVQAIEELGDGRVVLSLRESPFYAEKGGQTADIGWLESDTGKAEVLDVQEHGAVQVITARQMQGALHAGQRLRAVISTVHRHSVAANHTGTHLLHYALRTLLGDEATQAGSAVRADRFRFDFGYHGPIGPERVAAIEDLVNRKIVENHPVRIFTTSIEHARDLGATALFGEKYSDFVRVVEVDDFSRELCGGTHVPTTSEIGAFKVLSEVSVGANVRRIEAVTGRRAVEYYRERDQLLSLVATELQARDDQVLSGVAKLQKRVAELSDEIKELRSGKTADVVGDLMSQAKQLGAAKYVVTTIETRDVEQMLGIVDQVRDRLVRGVVALGASVDGNALLVVGVTRDLGATVHAGDIVKEAAPLVRGGGGGTSLLGRAGGGDPKGLEPALATIREAIEEALGR